MSPVPSADWGFHSSTRAAIRVPGATNGKSTQTRQSGAGCAQVGGFAYRVRHDMGAGHDLVASDEHTESGVIAGLCVHPDQRPGDEVLMPVRGLGHPTGRFRPALTAR